MRRLQLCFALSMALVFLMPVHASQESAGRIAIFFTSDAPETQWKAKAFQESVKSYISTFDRLQVELNDRELAKCSGFACQMDILRKNGISYFWTGALYGSRVDYEIYDVDTGSRVVSGRLGLNDWSGNGLQIQALVAVRPLIKNGGLIDLKKEKIQNKLKTENESGILMPFLKSPLGLFWALCAGIFWAALLLRLSRFCTGTLSGVQRINHANVANFIKAWLEVCVGKTLLVILFFGPILWMVEKLVAPLWLTANAYWFVVAPFVAFGAMFLLIMWVQSICLVLDRVLLKKSDKQYWHDKIQKYFQSYSDRCGVVLPESITEDLRFYVAKIPMPVVYGGVGNRVRIVFPDWIAEQALGSPPLYRQKVTDEGFWPTEREPIRHQERHAVLWPDEADPKARVRSKESVFDDLVKKKVLRSHEYHNPPVGEDAAPFATQAGVWGYILPNLESPSVPLISNDRQDLEVVDELIHEHHIQFARPQLEEIFDDADPSHKDFLFGGLMQQIGYVHRRDNLITTIATFVSLGANKLPHFLWRPLNAVYQIYERNFSRFPAILADAYPVLHHAGDHFVQYLYYVGSRKSDKFTSRLGRKSLGERTAEIFLWISQIKPDARDNQAARATYRNRFVWLSYFFSTAVAEYAAKGRIPWKRSLIAASVIATLGSESYIAYKYHPEYEKRMAEMKEKIEKKKEDEKSKGDKKNG